MSDQVLFNQLKIFNLYLIHLKLNSFEKTKQNYLYLHVLNVKVGSINFLF